MMIMTTTMIMMIIMTTMIARQWQNHPSGRQALPTTIPIKKTLTLLICDHPGVLGAFTVHSTSLILSRAPVNRPAVHR